MTSPKKEIEKMRIPLLIEINSLKYRRKAKKLKKMT
jgi:uncharacterized protein (UPF0216 family)